MLKNIFLLFPVELTLMLITILSAVCSQKFNAEVFDWIGLGSFAVAFLFIFYRVIRIMVNEIKGK